MREFDYPQLVERSLMKTFKGAIYSKFIQAIDEYRLIEDGDKVAIALSGGKDSFLMAKLFQTFQKYGHLHFEFVFLTMDPGFEENLVVALKENAEKLGIPLQIFPSKVFEVAFDSAPESPCFLCARMRRGFLYKKAQELGCNKLALGHHFDDVIETTLLNVFYAGTFKTMLPKAKSQNYPGMELIRPMYLIKERDSIRFSNYHKLVAMNCGCRISSCELDSKRKEIKTLIGEMRKRYKNTDINLFRSAENVNINHILGYFDDDNKYSFMDKYE